MILGDNQDKILKGPLAGIKKQWAKLPPKKQKTITISLFTVMILVFAAMGYHSRQSTGKHPKSKTHATTTKEISLNTDLIEKSLFRQAQDTINQQGRVIADMRKEIAHVKAVTEENAKNANSHEVSNVSPPPKTNNMPDTMQRSIPAPLSPPDYGAVPPPPIYRDAKPGDVDSLIGGISVVSNTAASEKKNGNRG